MGKGPGKPAVKRSAGARSNKPNEEDDVEKLKSLAIKQQKKLQMLQSSIKHLEEQCLSKSESSSKYFKNSGKGDNKKVQKAKEKEQNVKSEVVKKASKRKSVESEKNHTQQPGGKRKKVSELVTKDNKVNKDNEPITSKPKKSTNDKDKTIKSEVPKGPAKRKKTKDASNESSSSKKNKKKEKQVVTPKPIELHPGATLEEEVTALLKMHENIPMSQMNDEIMSDDDDDDDDSEDEDEGDWEEVEDAQVSPHKSPEKSQVPRETVQITLQGPQFNQKKKKKKFDMEEWFRLKVNRLKKETQTEAHKVHLLCLLAQCQQRRALCRRPLLLSAAFSHVPSAYHCPRPSMTWSLSTLTTFMRWFRGQFTLTPARFEEDWITESLLLKRLETRSVGSVTEFVLVFIIVLQAVGLDTRLVTSLRPLTFKASDLLGKGKGLRLRQPEVVDLTDKESTTDQQPEQSQSKPKAQPKNTKSRKTALKVGKDGKESKYFKQKGKGKVCEISSEGSDFEDELTTFRSPKGSAKKGKGKRHKILSSESDDSVKITKSKVVERGTDVWVEVYLDSENKWVCVNCVRGKINETQLMEEAATRPISYILAVDQDLKTKDVTRKYAGSWVTQTRKQRGAGEDWWEETLEPYRPVDLCRDRAEDWLIESQMHDKPLPTSMAEYKNNPIYALKRHLLKFEAIYPPDCAPVGFVKGEPVYPRSAVKELHTKDTWLKEARDIRRGEEPYKMVKARPKKGRGHEQPTEPTLPVYGEWQTEPYMPPPAVDGKVPRSDYGNVQLFKPCMLPGGTVHLKLPGLNRVAKKLNIDCAPAMVGWDFHGGFNHAMMDGFVVCEEFKDVLIAAWDEEQEIIAEREREKREKRILGNWKLLTRGLLLKEQVKKKFNLTEKDADAECSTSQTSSKGSKTSKKKQKDEKATAITHSWPLNRQAEKTDVEKEVATIQKKKRKPEDDDGNLFPFEVI